MQSKHKPGRIHAAQMAILAGTLSVFPLSFAVAAQDDQASADLVQAQAHETWRETMRHFTPPAEGCYHASYPTTIWSKVDCVKVPIFRSKHASRQGDKWQTTGNGYDYAVQAKANISEAIGSFPKVSGVKSETDSGSKNDYSLQLNTNFDDGAAACNGYSACYSWQQYLLVTNYWALTASQPTGKSEVFIQDWLENYGNDVDGGNTNICPSGWTDTGADQQGPGDDCARNSSAVVASNTQIPISSLASLKLSGTATANGNDTVTLSYDNEIYSVSTKDTLTDLASNWKQAEFNIVGNGGGSGATFNKGSSVTVNVAVKDGSTTAPTCLKPSTDPGTTGETNNLNLGSCTASAGSTSKGTNPSIQFTESN